MTLSPGDRFGNYTVVRLLGKGGMGSVFLLEAADGGQVAAKVLDTVASSDHEARRRFLREAQLALGVKHPNLVETYDVGEDPDTGLCYILMEYVPGGSLADYMRDVGALPVEDAVAVVEAMAAVLELARQKGVVHRDIKPANIMFDAEGTPKLADLGIARGGALGTETTTVTQTGVMIGTPAYMAPEQMLDAHNVDTRADIYSLGVVFFEMLTGERPNKDDTVVQLMAKAVKGEPLPDVRTLRPEVSASLAQLLAMMVAPDKDGRISTPGQITNALDIIERGGTFESRSAEHERRREAVRQARRRKKRFRLALISCLVLAVVCVLAGVGVGLCLLQRKTASQPKPVAAAPQPVVQTVVVTNTVEKSVVQVRTVTNVLERTVAVPDGTPALKEEPSDRLDRTAFERRVGHILIRSSEGVRRDVVARVGAWIEQAMPRYKAMYGDPYAAGLKQAPFVLRLNYQANRKRSGSYRPGHEGWEVEIGEDGDWILSGSTLSYMLAASLVFAPERNWASLVFYANHLLTGSEAETLARVVEQGRSVDPKMNDYDWRGNPARQGVPSVNGGKNYYALHQWRSFGPLEELRKDQPTLMRAYFALKLQKSKAGDLGSGLSVEEEVGLFSSVMGKNVRSVFVKYGWPFEGAGSAGRSNRTVSKVSPRKLFLADLPETPRRDLQTQTERIASRWRDARGCLVTGRLLVQGEARPSGVATWAWLAEDGTFTAAVYHGRSIVFEKHGYEVVEIPVPQANQAFDGSVVYDFGTVNIKRLPETKSRTIGFDLSLPEGVKAAEVELSLYNNEPVGSDWSVFGRVTTTVPVERRTCAAGEKVEFKGCAFSQYKLSVTAVGCPAYRKTLSAFDDTVGTVKMSRTRYAVFSLRQQGGGTWAKKAVLVDSVNALMLKEETDEWGNRCARLYLDPYASDRGVGIHFSFGPDYYDDLGELSAAEYDAMEKSGKTASARRLDTRGREFLPGHVYRMQESHWKIDMLISFDFYGSPEEYAAYVAKQGLADEMEVADEEVTTFDYEARFPATVPIGVELKRAGTAAKTAVEKKERQLAEVKERFGAQAHEFASATTESEARRVLAGFEKLVRRYQSIRLSPTGRWSLKRDEVKVEADRVREDMLVFLQYVLCTRCSTGAAAPVLKKRIRQLKKDVGR